MNTQSNPLSKTLKHVILATLVLVALVLLLSERSEAAVRVNSRTGSARLTTCQELCCGVNAPAARTVEVRSVGRQRIVVRNGVPGHRKCGGLLGQHRHHSRIWVPGHYEPRVKRQGRLNQIWVPGHWVRR